MMPLVLVHGFMGGSAQWAPQVKALSEQFEIIAVDLPGFGENSLMPAIHTIEGFAAWVIDLLRDRGITRYHLLGHSMGGMVVQEIVRLDSARIEKLILYGTGAVGVLPGRFETIEQSKIRARKDGPRKTARRIAATWFLDQEHARGYADCAALAERASAEAIAAGLDAMQGWSGEENLGQISQKTQIIWGEQDRTYPWEQTHLLWRTIPDAGLSVIPSCAHAVHAENPEFFNERVLSFLTRDS